MLLRCWLGCHIEVLVDVRLILVMVLVFLLFFHMTSTRSFDVVRTSLGLVRTEFPHAIYCVTGIQAHNAPNSIGIFKISNISGKRQELVPTKTSDDTDMDSESSDSDDDEENGGSKPPVF